MDVAIWMGEVETGEWWKGRGRGKYNFSAKELSQSSSPASKTRLTS